MKFKLDENLPVDAAKILEQAGHDAVTVVDQQLIGTNDLELASLCQKEKRALLRIKALPISEPIRLENSPV